MLKFLNVSKSFSQRGLVLDNLCLDVISGETLAIMGPSGSGKTTFMNITGLLDKPDSGEIFFKGEAIAGFGDDKSAEYRNQNIGFVFQDHLLLPHLTVAENISIPLLASGYTREILAGRQENIKVLIEKTGLSGLISRYPHQISGGEAQRVALVRALANKPSILLADEPTGSLDSKNAEYLGDLLLEMNKTFGITLVVSTHSLDLAKKMSRLLRLENGKLVN